MWYSSKATGCTQGEHTYFTQRSPMRVYYTHTHTHTHAHTHIHTHTNQRITVDVAILLGLLFILHLFMYVHTYMYLCTYVVPYSTKLWQWKTWAVQCPKYFWQRKHWQIGHFQRTGDRSSVCIIRVFPHLFDSSSISCKSNCLK